ncbi:MAG: hypothetical protein RR319_03915 [Bacteroides sp.]
MPYRRLPKTDRARIKTLQIIVDKSDAYSMYDFAISLKTSSEAKTFLEHFEASQIYYKNCLKNQTSSSDKYQRIVKTARIYISHFIQVLNLAVIRSEIKVNHKNLYGLSVENNNIPDLTNEIGIIEWGAKIIKGEKERLRNGGIPIYNPTIAKVSVHYDIFRDAYENQKNLQVLTSRSLKVLADMRGEADRIILDAWNQIEKSFENYSSEEKMNKCREYGIIYYYRTGEYNPHLKEV